MCLSFASRCPFPLSSQCVNRAWTVENPGANPSFLAPYLVVDQGLLEGFALARPFPSLSVYSYSWLVTCCILLSDKPFRYRRCAIKQSLCKINVPLLQLICRYFVVFCQFS